MEKTREVDAQSLRGPELAWALAEALNWSPTLLRGDFELQVIAVFERSPHGGLGRFGPFDPAARWDQGGPLLYDNAIAVGPSDCGVSVATGPSGFRAYGSNYLEAGMRCLLREKTGGRPVTVPEILLEDAAHARAHPRWPSGQLKQPTVA